MKNTKVFSENNYVFLFQMWANQIAFNLDSKQYKQAEEVAWQSFLNNTISPKVNKNISHKLPKVQ